MADDLITASTLAGDTGPASTPSKGFSENVASTNSTLQEELSITESDRNATDVFDSESPDTLAVLEVFIIIEIVMTTLEIIIWVVAAIKIKRWSKNYRNQMLLQLSVARFLKRVVFLMEFLKNSLGVIPNSDGYKFTLLSSAIYIDFVIVILVFFFIKHMYDSLIVVMVKIRETSLWKVVICTWVVPLPASGAFTGVLAAGLLDYWRVYLIVCCLFRWPLMLIGTVLYLTILYRVLNDRIRKFARSLTIITFLMCLLINFYLFSKDVILLWCLQSFTTLLTNHISGLLMNILILSFYIILIMLNYKCNIKNSVSIPNFSISLDK